MINAALDLIIFLKSTFTLLFPLVIYTILAIALSKSIKKNYKVYYWIFGILSFCFIIPSVARLTGTTLPFNLGNIPIVGLCASELSSAANFIHPILIIIMYMGAFSPKLKYVGRLMSIRKELSIIVGFPVLAHVTKRLFGSFVEGWSFFFDNEVYMQSPKVSSALGSGITSFAFVLGIVMAVLFLVLWITSFDSVRKKLGGKRWKAVQKWSYGLYAMLFIHSLCLSVGGLISDNARAAKQAQQVVVAQQAPTQSERPAREPQPQAQAQQAQAQQGGHSHGAQAQAQQGGHGHGHGHGRPSQFKFEEKVNLSRADKRLVSIFVLLGIYGSYLYFRLRKACRDKRNKR